MAKPKAPKVPIGPETLEALKSLHAQVEAAEKLLSKLPGASVSGVYVDLDDMFLDPVDIAHAQSVCMTFDGDRGQLIVKYYDPAAADEFRWWKTLEELPTTRRIEVANCIPDLIRKAIDAESQVASLAAIATKGIQEAIHEATEAN